MTTPIPARGQALLAAWVGGMVCSFAAAWTPSLEISDPKATNAHVARAADGGAHVSYYADWRIKYRHRSTIGQWGPIEDLTGFFSHRNDVIEDGEGIVHVLFVGDGAGGKADLYHARKVAGTWQIAHLTNTAGYDEDEPKLATDSQGRVHLVYTKSTGGNTIMYRMWNGAVWSAETPVSSGGNSYYHRPDISIAPDGHIHVVHATNYTLQYVRHNGTSWSSPVTIGTGSNFFAFPRITAISPTHAVAVVFDQIGNGQLRYTVSTNGGTNWSGLQYLEAGHWPNMDSDPAGNAHIAFHWLGVGGIGYKRWNGSAWTATESVAPHPNWQGWADVAAGSDGVVHVVYDDAKPENARISYVASQATPFVRPDLDRDGDVDLEDFGLLQACYSGEFIPQHDPACLGARMDGDEDVDQQDAAIFLGCLSGPSVPYDPDCAG